MKSYAVVITMVLLSLTSCNDRRVYSQYGHTPVTGWEKREPVIFDIPSLESDGIYNMALALRMNDTYPFKNLHLIVRQRLLPSGHQVTDTLTFNITDERGTMLGNGITFYQYERPIRKIKCHEGDSLHIEVSHNMKREILPGIADVGFCLNRE